jgi:hypothetical protein
MTYFHDRTLATFAWCLLLGAATAHAEISLIGTGAIPGTARDQSGLSNVLEDNVTPGDLIGGLGSAVTYGGSRNIYYAVPDRGPADGATTYKDRLYTLEIDVTKTAPNAYKIDPRVTHTRLLRAKTGVFTGSAAVFDAVNSPESLRFDPEGLRVSGCGDSVYVSDEYGPFVYEFLIGSGKRVRSLGVPNKFLIDLPSATANDELTKNLAGRQSNRGMEGLAISPDGRKLYGIMQSALIQDGALDAMSSRIGLNNRILEIDVETGAVRELVYPLEEPANGVSEIVAVNDREFLVLERDGRAGAAAVFKKIFKIDISEATDVRTIKTLPTSGLPADVVAVTKALFLDLLEARFGLAGPTFPEKLEALAFGPALGDGRLLLFVVSDNDFLQNQNTNFYAFAIDRSDLPGYAPQEVQRGRNCAPRDDED